MAFSQLNVLWALFALLIPVVIHLFNFRRYKRIVFPDIRLLQQIDHQTKSGNRLKRLLILLSRLLALAFLIFAFAQPYIPLKDRNFDTGKKYISILIDNSFSMNITGEEGQLLESAKNRARAIVSASGNGDEFNIITSDMDASLLHFAGKQATLENIDRIRISKLSYPLEDLLSLQNSSLRDKTGSRYAYTLSDFQRSVSEMEKNPIDSGIRQTWIRIPSAEADNQSLDSCWLLSPVLQTGSSINLMYSVSNFSKEEVKGAKVELWIDGKPKGLSVSDIPAFGSSRKSIGFVLESGGKNKCELRLQGDNIPLDDVLYFYLNINSSYRVLNIAADNERYVHAVFSDNPGYVLTQENSERVNYSNFKQYDLIVIQGADNLQSGFISELEKYLNSGGSVLIFPNTKQTAGGLKEMSGKFGFTVSDIPNTFKVKVNYIDREHPIFKNLFEKTPQNPDLPEVSKYFEMNFSKGIPVMKLANGKSFLEDIQFGKGHLLVSSVALDPAFSNFQMHALFVPVCLRSAIMSKYRIPLYYNCNDAGDMYTGLPFESENGWQLKGENTAYVPEFINKNGDLYINTNGEISEAGHYSLYNSKTDTSLCDLAFNTGRRESDTRTFTESEFNDICEKAGIEHYEGSAEKLSSELAKVRKGTVLWKWCILFSLICLLIEILLIRFFRNNVKLPA